MYQVANIAGGQISNVYIEPQGLIDHTHKIFLLGIRIKLRHRDMPEMSAAGNAAMLWHSTICPALGRTDGRDIYINPRTYFEVKFILLQDRCLVLHKFTRK
jgi:hypothetical protein